MSVNDNAVVFDAGSTKGFNCECVASLLKKNYLACHPIAGTEFSWSTASH